MILGIIISALIILESREIFNGLLSQPFVISLLFIFWGYDPVLILSSALIIQLTYLNFTPSGASLFPEYPFAFFIVFYSTGVSTLGGCSQILCLLYIILISGSTAQLVMLKRKIFYRYKDLLMIMNRHPSLIKTLLFSFLFYSVYSFVIILILKGMNYLIYDLYSFSFSVIIENSSVTILSLTFILYNLIGNKLNFEKNK